MALVKTVVVSNGLVQSGTSGTAATADIANNAVTNAIIRDGVACSVIGRRANSTGDPADIQAASNEQGLFRTGDALSFQNAPRLLSTPANTGSFGVAGCIAFDSSFLYVCIGSNTWKRVAIASW